MNFTVIIIFIINTLFIDEPFEQLSVLKGKWKMETSNGTIYETWNGVTNSSMTGWSYKVNGTDTTMKESITLQKSDSAINYIVTTEEQNNREQVSFKLISTENKTFIFENKQHDFPKRISYRLINNDSIIARIEGDINGKKSSFDFKYSRLK